METKKCTKCGDDIDVSLFSPTSKNKNTGKQYYHSHCNPCRTQSDRDKRGQKEPKRFAKKTDTHRECMECHKMFLYEDINGSYCKTCKKEKYYDKEKARLATKRYRENHPERWKAKHRIHQYNRKNLIKATDDGTVTDCFLKEILNKECCCWCNEKIKYENRTIEHVIELSAGGLHSSSNIDMACSSCNSSRKNRGKL